MQSNESKFVVKKLSVALELLEQAEKFDASSTDISNAILYVKKAIGTENIAVPSSLEPSYIPDATYGSSPVVEVEAKKSKRSK